MLTYASGHPQKLQPPLSGDDAALKKYADQMEALRKQVQIPRLCGLLTRCATSLA